MPVSTQHEGCKCPCHAGFCLHIVPCCSRAHIWTGDPLNWLIERMSDRVKLCVGAHSGSNQLVSLRKDFCA